MQGRCLLTFLIFLSFPFCAQAQDDPFAPELDAPALDSPAPMESPSPEFAPPSSEPTAAEAPPSISPSNEPDPTSTLTPKAATSSSDEFSEFEESGGPPPAKPAPAAPLVAEKIAPTKPVIEVKPSEAAPLPVAQPTPLPVMPAPKEKVKEKVKVVQKPAPLPAEKKTKFYSRSSAPPVQSLGGDEPDFSKEEQLHRTYEKYNAQPTSETSWEKAVSAGKAQIYNVQSGDTLWDISQTLFGDSQFWPKVWSMNNQTFPNPHEITPTTKIQFFKGGLNEAPSMAVSNPEKPLVVAPPLAKNESDVGGQANDAPAAVFPAPSRKTKILKLIPDSLPLYRLGGVNKANTNVEIINGRKDFVEPLVSMTHYIVEGELPAVGVVVETEKGGQTASEFQYVILQLDQPEGKSFHIARALETVRNPKVLNGASGRMVEVQGEVEVLEKVAEDKNLYRAIVKKAISPIAVGAKVLKGPLALVDVAPGPAAAATQATLIGGQYSAERRLFPQFSFVFVDAGSNSGMKEGQTLNVFANLKSRNDKTVVENKNRWVGQVKIIKTSENFSTAYVTAAFEELQAGDHIGSGATQTTAEKVSAEAQGKPADTAAEPLESTEAPLEL